MRTSFIDGGGIRGTLAKAAALCGGSSRKALLSGLLLLFSFCLQSHAHSEAALSKVVVASATAADYREFNTQVKALERTTCDGSSRYFEKPMVVENLVGADVSSIRVTHFSPHNNPPKSDEIRKIVKRVWHDSFQSASCGIVWAEGVLWSIQCTLEFKDGKRGVLITDGSPRCSS